MKSFMALFKQFIVFICVAGLLVAILSLFGWDVIATMQWFFSKTWEIILKIAETLTGAEGFRKIFK